MYKAPHNCYVNHDHQKVQLLSTLVGILSHIILVHIFIFSRTVAKHGQATLLVVIVGLYSYHLTRLCLLISKFSPYKFGVLYPLHKLVLFTIHPDISCCLCFPLFLLPLTILYKLAFTIEFFLKSVASPVFVSLFNC